MTNQSRQDTYQPDVRANRLEAWKFEQTGKSWFLHFRSSPETKRHIIGALPRAVDVRTLKYDPEWPYRIRFDFNPPDEIVDFLEMLKKALVIEVAQEGFLDAAVALDLYQRRVEGEFLKTTIGRLISQAKGYNGTDRVTAELASKTLCNYMSEVVRRHQWLTEATRLLPVPGHTSDDAATSVRLGVAIAQKVGIQTVHVHSHNKFRKPAKLMTPRERAGLLHEFRVDDDLDARTVLILDDFYHSGWTMAGVAHAARKAGAATVLGLAAVRNYQR